MCSHEIYVNKKNMRQCQSRKYNLHSSQQKRGEIRLELFQGNSKLDLNLDSWFVVK